MKLRNLLEVEYGIQDVLAQYMDQIKVKYGPEQYRQLQTLMSQQKDSEVEKWITQEKELGKLEDPDDAPPNDKAIPLSLDTTSYEVDALSEDEEYCPVCAKKLKEIIRKSIDECWKTHKQVGMKKKGGKTVPNCVPKNEEVDEAKKGKCKPSKGKRFAKRVSGKCRSYGQAGKAKKGGDRIRPGTAKGHAYCARSAKIKKCKNPPCANALTRKKWKCQGTRSVK